MRADDFWRGVFGRAVPVEVEIGPGRGDLLLAAAAAAPERSFLAIEFSSARAARLIKRVQLHGLSNVRVLRGDAVCVVCTVIPDGSVSAYHTAFPDPWWKRRHRRRRLYSEAFVAGLARTLVQGGRVHVASDVAEYFALITDLLGALLRREQQPLDRPVVSEFERKARARNTAIHAASFLKPGD